MTGFIVFAHGSRIESANQAVRDVAVQMAASGQHIVEAAFLELGQPDLTAAAALLIARGAKRIIVIPYFLTLGTHMQRDLPRLAQATLPRSRGHRDADHLPARWPSSSGPGAARSCREALEHRMRATVLEFHDIAPEVRHFVFEVPAVAAAPLQARPIRFVE